MWMQKQSVKTNNNFLGNTHPLDRTSGCVKISLKIRQRQTVKILYWHILKTFCCQAEAFNAIRIKWKTEYIFWFAFSLNRWGVKSEFRRHKQQLVTFLEKFRKAFGVGVFCCFDRCICRKRGHQSQKYQAKSKL